MRRRALRFLPLALLAAASILPLSLPAGDKPAVPDANKLVLHTRTEVETAPKSGRYHTLTQTTTWDARKTAIVVCDMWDKHWCPTATQRVGEMAPRMNEVLKAARDKGALIIHCPSDTMGFYKDAPQRRRAQQAPKVEAKVMLQPWCRIDPKHEAPLPIDDGDGGCDCDPQPKNYRAWSRQIEALEIKDADAITDSAEAYYLMQQQGIDNVIVMGVHTNMCVLGRPFSIRQMIYQGKNVLLMRDMTDTMYNPRSRPKVSHFTGTDLVVSHIERHWCPTITSADFLGGKPFRFKEDKRPHLAILMGENEYHTEVTLPPFALKQLGKDFRISTVYASATTPNEFPGLEVLDEADLVLISIRRRALPEEQLERIRKFVSAGKPIVGIRTSSHAFTLREGAPPKGHAEWREFDQAVLGGHYTNHHGANEKTVIAVKPEAEKHPILAGMPKGDIGVASTLYMTSPLRDKATVLMMGRVEGKNPEPVAWTHTHSGGGRVFYTSLGHTEDFKIPAMRRLLRNGIYWAAGLPVPDGDVDE
jgi:type 1 glutamine amidotransferase/nicotinamidase-related amidase